WGNPEAAALLRWRRMATLILPDSVKTLVAERRYGRRPVEPKPPDERRIANLIAEGQIRYKQANENWNRIAELFYQEHQVQIPKLYQSFVQPVRSNRFHDDVRRVVQRLCI